MDVLVGLHRIGYPTGRICLAIVIVIALDGEVIDATYRGNQADREIPPLDLA